MLSFISGGARSGKSAFAERRAIQLHEQAVCQSLVVRCVYLATCPVMTGDDEMNSRIRRHQQDRSHTVWHTMEETLHIDHVIRAHRSHDVILLDCLTLWLSNAMFQADMNERSCIEYIEHCLAMARRQKLHLLIVSNDVNEDVPIRETVVQSYIRTLQQLHHRIVEHADEAVQVITGVPIWRKGGGR